MTIKIIKCYIILLVIFFSWTSFASADLIINKVNLDPIGERFIQLHNNSNLSQDLTGWSIKRKSSSGKEYSLVASSRLENKIIPTNGYFLLVNEGNYTGTLTPDATWAKSYSFAENNIILLYNQNDELVDDFSVSASISNSEIINNGLEDEDYSDEDIISISEEDNPEILKIKTKIISPKIVTAGIPFSLNSLTTTNRKETYKAGRFVWNFGDGMIKRVGESSPFEYTYKYPGEYALTLSYYDSVFSINPDAVDKIIIKVVPSSINISSVGNYDDPFVEIENKSNYEIILSNWIITAGTHFFIIPEGTTLLPNKKIKLSPKITSFVGEDIKSVVITSPNKEIIATYPIQIKKPIQKNTSVYTITQNNVFSPDDNLQDDSLPQGSQVINLNDLGASAEESGVNISNSTYALIGLLVVIGLGISSFLLIKKKRDVSDYVEKGIRAEDMTIIE